MPSWKKIIVSGSDAEFNNVTASAGINFVGHLTGSITSTGSLGTVEVADERLISNGKISLHGLNTYPNEYVSIKRGTQTQLSVNGATGGVAMGAGASATGDGVSIGYLTTAGGGSSVAIGRGLTTTANQVRIGESGVTDAYLGQGNATLHIGGVTGSLTSTGSFGHVVATTFVGDGSGLTGLTSAAIETYSNSGNNRILTSVDSSTVNSEANLTFDGSTLEVIGSVSGSSTSTGSFGLVELAGNSVANEDLIRLNYANIGDTSNYAALSVNAQGSLKIESPANNSYLDIDLYNGTNIVRIFKNNTSQNPGIRKTLHGSSDYVGISDGTRSNEKATFYLTGGNRRHGLGGDIDAKTTTLMGQNLYIKAHNDTGSAAPNATGSIGKIGINIHPESASAQFHISASGNNATASIFKVSADGADVLSIDDAKISGSATTSASFGRLDINPGDGGNTNGVAISALNGAFEVANTAFTHEANGGNMTIGSTNTGGLLHSSGKTTISRDAGLGITKGLYFRDNPQSAVISMDTAASLLFGNNPSSTSDGFERMKLTVSGALVFETGSYGVSGSLTSTGSFGSVFATTLNGSGGGITDIPNTALTNDGITIAGQDISLGGSITADTIAGQISNDGISGDQINGGTIGSTTITTLTTTDVTVGGTLTVNGTLTYISSSNLRVQDNFAFLATGSADTNVDAGIIAQSGSADLTGSALYHDTSDKRWSVATQVASNATAVTPLQYLTTVKVSDLEASLNDNKTYTGSADYGKGEMVVDADGEIFIYT